MPRIARPRRGQSDVRHPGQRAGCSNLADQVPARLPILCEGGILQTFLASPKGGRSHTQSAIRLARILSSSARARCSFRFSLRRLRQSAAQFRAEDRRPVQATSTRGRGLTRPKGSEATHASWCDAKKSREQKVPQKALWWSAENFRYNFRAPVVH